MGAHLLDPGYFTESDLAELGFRSLGTNILIARDSIFVGIPNIAIGNHVRIDSNVTFASISGSLTIGDYVHIGGGSHINCTGGVVIGDFVAISQGVKIYSASDDYSGEFMTNPTVPRHLRRDQVGEISIGGHVIIGSGSVILPGVRLGEGAAIGALSVVKSNVPEFTVAAGSPAKFIRNRSRKVLALSQELIPGTQVRESQ
jgi:acetyltransferase-like isoleucine patch superfamily enzyme